VRKHPPPSSPAQGAIWTMEHQGSKLGPCSDQDHSPGRGPWARGIKGRSGKNEPHPISPPHGGEVEVGPPLLAAPLRSPNSFNRDSRGGLYFSVRGEIL